MEILTCLFGVGALLLALAILIDKDRIPILLSAALFTVVWPVSFFVHAALGLLFSSDGPDPIGALRLLKELFYGRLGLASQLALFSVCAIVTAFQAVRIGLRGAHHQAST